jgi:GNAT superfamily N-acetyltransferase
MPPSTVAYIDVAAGPPRRDLFASFVALYDETFTDPTEREDPCLWPERLWPEGGARPHSHLVVAVDPGQESRDILGGCMFEYYANSRCGLISYLVVAPEQRGHGIARQLIRLAASTLQADASANGDSLVAVFAEAEDPWMVRPEDSPIDPFDRLRAFRAIGARWIDIPYVQPALVPGGSRCLHLVLLSFPLQPDQPLPDRMDGRDLLTYLREFYMGLGVDTEHDSDFRAIDERVGQTVELRDLAEIIDHA